MKKRVLGLIASYRRLGNSEIATKAIAREMGEEWELSLVRLARLEIAPCRGCYACLIPDRTCRIEDDLVWLLEEIKKSDAVIMAAPNYVLGPVGTVKMIADRVLQAVSCFPFFQKIPTAVILTLGLEKYNGIAQTALATHTSSLGLKVVRVESFLGTHPGEAALDGSFHERVRDIAQSLVNPEMENRVSPRQCPRCFSDLFRPHKDGGLECAVCKSLAHQNGSCLEFYFFDPEFSKKGQEKHLEWLLGKKLEFETMKEKLDTVKQQYRDGDWISPR